MRLVTAWICMSVGYMLQTSSDAATTRSDHVRSNTWDMLSVAVGGVGCGSWAAVEESCGVAVGVEEAMVSGLLLLLLRVVMRRDKKVNK